MANDELEEAVEIGEKARGRSFESLLLGNKVAALGHLKEGVHELEKLPKRHSLTQLIRILADMGRLGDREKFDQGRKLLQEWDATRGGQLQVDDDREESPQEKFRRNLKLANERLELACCLEDWDEAKKTYQREAGLIPFLFEVDGNNPFAIFDKLKELLGMGQLLEEGLEPFPGFSRMEPARRSLPPILIALECYNWGCFLSNIFHRHFNRPAALVTILDHDYCSTLFTSAARLCVKLASMDPKIVKTPEEHKHIKPAMEASDWQMQALVFLERGKARSLLDAIVQQKVTAIPHGESTSLMDRANNFANAVIEASAKLSVKRHGHKSSVSSNSDIESNSLLSTPSTSPTPEPPILKPRSKSPMRLLNSMKMNTVRKWQRAILSIGGASETQFVPTRIDNKDIQRILLHLPPDTAILEFGVDSNAKNGGILVIGMTRDSGASSENNIVSHWQALDPEGLKAMKRHITVLRWRMRYKCQEDAQKKKGILDLLIQNDIVSDEADMEVKENLAKSSLAKLLLEPFSRLLVNKPNLIIVPSNNLSHVPWSMIPLSSQGESPKCVVDNHCVSMIPSLCIWNRLRLKSVQPPQRSPKALIVTNSPFDPARRGAPRIDRIQYSRVEALYLASAHKEKPVLADEPQAQSFKEMVEQSQIVHLSAHGDFDNDFPLKSKIHLFQNSLSVMDFRQFELQASLVVFSSCLSGLSRSSDSGSSFSFAHALLGSGARAFIGTLWPVDDAATLIFMMLFYERLQEGLSPAASLRSAKLRMRRLSKEDLDQCVLRLKGLLHHSDWSKYVYNLRWWLEVDLPRRNVERFREEQYWAPFVLTGYGNRPIYEPVVPEEKKRRLDMGIFPKRSPRPEEFDESEPLFFIQDVS
jgi:CHAT domain-containing protein